MGLWEAAMYTMTSRAKAVAMPAPAAWVKKLVILLRAMACTVASTMHVEKKLSTPSIGAPPKRVDNPAPMRPTFRVTNHCRYRRGLRVMAARRSAASSSPTVLAQMSSTRSWSSPRRW